MKTSEACLYLGGISRKTYQGYIKSGRIKAALIKGRWEVETEELNRFLQEESGLLPEGVAVGQETIIAQIMSLEHVKPEHKSLVEDYARECVTLVTAKTSRERNESLVRKIRLAEALLITPRSLSRLQELNQQLDLANNLNDLLITAIEADPDLGHLYKKKAGLLSEKVFHLSQDFLKSQLPYQEWKKHHDKNLL
jgi:hypothetical protein